MQTCSIADKRVWSLSESHVVQHIGVYQRLLPEKYDRERGEVREKRRLNGKEKGSGSVTG